MKNVVIVDGDLLLYKATAAVQKTFKFTGPVPAISADFCEAVKIIDREILVLRRTLDAGDVIIALSDPDSSANWRKQVLPSYKATRNPAAKPILYKQGRQELESRFNTKWYPGLEADDVSGIFLTTPGHPERLAWGWDKDDMSVPGRHYNPRKPEEGIVTVTVEQADRFHLMQTLMGDAVDNYKGIPGVGPKKAAAILDAQHPAGMTPWQRVCHAYRSEGLTENDALTQARVARILRHGEWNRHVGVCLWVPQQETT